MSELVTESSGTAGGLAYEARAAIVVWRREMIRFRQDRMRILTMLLQPLLFLFVMGSGLASVIRTDRGLDFRTFLFPGVLAMSMVLTASFAGITLVWDRELGFLREILVAPVSSSSIVIGKCLGGATATTVQSCVLLVLAGLVGVPYHPLLIIELVALLFVGAFMLTAAGVLLSVRLRQIQTAVPASHLIVMPAVFLSGALFPMVNLPGWLSLLAEVNPLTYVVQPMRAVIFDHAGVPAEARSAFDPSIFWGGWQVPVVVQLLVVAGFTTLLVVVAVIRFPRTG
jgi:ABC-2 type transport system permease protein